MVYIQILNSENVIDLLVLYLADNRKLIVCAVSQWSGLSLQISPCTPSGPASLGPQSWAWCALLVDSIQTRWVWSGYWTAVCQKQAQSRTSCKVLRKGGKHSPSTARFSWKLRSGKRAQLFSASQNMDMARRRQETSVSVIVSTSTLFLKEHRSECLCLHHYCSQQIDSEILGQFGFPY